MKKFGEGNTPFYAEDDIPDNHPDELDHITDQFMNNVYGESKSLIESSGQQLKGATTEDLKQTAKAVFILSGKVGYFTSDSSTANIKVLKPYDNNIIIPDLSLLDGFEFKFLNKGTNTGNVTVIVEGTGQSQALPVLDANANQIAVGDMKDGGMYSLRYFAALNAFMFFSVSFYTKPEADERFFHDSGRIVAGSNLNTFQQEFFTGTVTLNADAASILNIPASFAGRLTVESQGTTTKTVLQTYRTYRNEIYVRRGYKTGNATVPEDGWSEWELVLTSTNSFSTGLIGVPLPYPLATAPTGFITMAGQAINSGLYPKLSAIYGANLPDLRGLFIRGWDNNRGLDPGRALLNYQEDAIQNITGAFNHAVLWSQLANGSFRSSNGGATGVQDNGAGTSFTHQSVTFDASRVVRTAVESRPKNMAFNYITPLG